MSKQWQTRPHKVREASLVHRLFGIKPGHAPERAYRACRGSCEPSWREFVLVWIVIGFALLAWWVAGWPGVGGVTTVVLVAAVLIARFASRERFGRAPAPQRVRVVRKRRAVRERVSRVRAHNVSNRYSASVRRGA